MRLFLKGIYKFVFLPIVFLLGSCIKDKCGKVICNNQGVCVDGSCTCPSGYEGTFCDTAWFEKFKGTWHADETFIRDTNATHFEYELSIQPYKNFADSFSLVGLSDSFKNLVCFRTSKFGFEFKEDQKFDSVTLKSGRGLIDPGSNTISGLYTFRINGYIFARSSTDVEELPSRSPKYQLVRRWIDTTITTNFKWKQE